MKRKINTGAVAALFLAALLALSCTKDQTAAATPESWSEGAELRLGVSFRTLSSRLAELPNTDAMNDSIVNGKNYGLNNIGLYIYYTEDYNRDDLSNPYLRNVECEVVDGMLQPVIAEGEDPANAKIFIYDRMTIVAFYPYNREMNDPKNYFDNKADQEKYTITRSDYSQQYYIPYMAQKETNPTLAFYTDLHFYPKDTYKIEIVVVSDDLGDFPDQDNIQILPSIDPIDSDLTTDSKREAWFDDPVVVLSNGGGGSHVAKYTAYIWTNEENDNDIEAGTALLRSDKLTLLASQKVTVAQDRVYRYGYNMSTGEIFIPTSSNLIHDCPTLQSVNNSQGDGYQVCDIDVSVAGDWTPLNKIKGRFDGGGHEITGLNVTSPSGKTAGLFGKIQGSAVVANVNLIDPVINITSADTCYVGALCGRLNSVLSEEDKLSLIDHLPEELSPVVKKALIEELLASVLNNEAKIVASKVTNPTITVKSLAPRVGTICGDMGDKDEDGNYKAIIWDTYSLGGTIAVNVGSEANNEGGYVGGFCGLCDGKITRSLCSIADITFQQEVEVTENNVTTTQLKDDYTGFTTIGVLFPASDAYATSSYSMLADANAASLETSWPNWATYTGSWPVLTTGWLGSPGLSFWYNTGTSPSIYPTLQWERR